MIDFFNLQNIFIEKIEENTIPLINGIDKEYIIIAHTIQKPELCPHCNEINCLHEHGTIVQKYRDLNFGCHKIIWHIKIHRYKCKNTDKTLIAEMPDIQPDRQMTKRLYEYIKQQSINELHRDIALRTGVKTATVNEIFKKQYYDFLESKINNLPKTIGVHIIKLKDNLEGTIVVDVIREELLFILPNKDLTLLASIPVKYKETMSPLIYYDMDIDMKYFNQINEIFPRANLAVSYQSIVGIFDIALLETVKYIICEDNNSKKYVMFKKEYQRIFTNDIYDIDKDSLCFISKWIKYFYGLSNLISIRNSLLKILKSNSLNEQYGKFQKWLDTIDEQKQYVLLSALKKRYKKHLNGIYKSFENPPKDSYYNTLESYRLCAARIEKRSNIETVIAKLLLAPNPEQVLRQGPLQTNTEKNDSYEPLEVEPVFKVVPEFYDEFDRIIYEFSQNL